MAFLFGKVQGLASQFWGLVADRQDKAQPLSWEGTYQEDVSCCRVVWVLKD